MLRGFAAALMVATGMYAWAQNQAPMRSVSPGLAMAGSEPLRELPSKARSFIDRHFKGTPVKSCERYFAKGTYEVELRGGLDIEFNTKGEVTEIDAPSRTVLTEAVVKDVLPHKAYDKLAKNGLATSVESIEFNRGKVYEVELAVPEPDTYIFDLDGTFLAIQD